MTHAVRARLLPPFDPLPDPGGGRRPVLPGGQAAPRLTWRRKNGERVPDECIELDPARLKRASSNGTIHRHEGREDMDWSEIFGLSVSPAELIIRGTVMYLFLFLLFRVVIRLASARSEWPTSSCL